MSSGLSVVRWALVIALTAGGAARLNAQGMQVDSIAAARGKRVWTTRQCSGCHELGRNQSSGPDLIGVTDRRSTAWLRMWLKDPVTMAGNDSTAAALKKQFNSQMPNPKLSNDEVDALINYLAEKTQEHRAGK